MSIVKQITKELKKNIDPTYNVQQFFKQPVPAYGVRYPIVRKIAKEFYPKEKTKEEIFKLSEELCKLNIQEEKVVAFEWIYAKKDQFKKSDFKFFEHLLKTYVNNWALCDDLAPTTLNYMITTFPELIPKTQKWTKSKNKYVRRAACVVHLKDFSGRKPNQSKLEEIFHVCNILKFDKEDIVQKGYGWLLKNTSKTYPKQVYQYILKNKDMPRTSLRYALEYYSKEERKKAMK